MSERNELVERLLGEVDRMSNWDEAALKVVEDVKNWATEEKGEKEEFLKRLIDKMNGYDFGTEFPNEDAMAATSEIQEWAEEEMSKL